MSRLWSNLAHRLAPDVPDSLGIGFCGNRLNAVEVVREAIGWRIVRTCSAELPFVPYRGEPAINSLDALNQAFESLGLSAGKRYLPMQIAVPEPDALLHVLELDVMPEKTVDQINLARFRIEKELANDVTMSCAIQRLGEKDERELLLGVAVRKSWNDLLLSACRHVGLSPAVMDLAVFHVYNLFYDGIEASPGPGVLLTLNTASWSLLCWDYQKRPRMLRSRWRVVSEQSDLASILSNAERITRTFFMSQTEHQAEAVYVCNDDPAAQKSLVELDARFGKACIHLNPVKDIQVGDSGISQQGMSGTLAAAMARR